MNDALMMLLPPSIAICNSHHYIQYTAVQCCVMLYTQAERGLLSRLVVQRT